VITSRSRASNSTTLPAGTVLLIRVLTGSTGDPVAGAGGVGVAGGCPFAVTSIGPFTAGAPAAQAYAAGANVGDQTRHAGGVALTRSLPARPAIRLRRHRGLAPLT
jgi:hypothetical protein